MCNESKPIKNKILIYRLNLSTSLESNGATSKKKT